MPKLYTYYRKRGTLHIYGCCQYSTDPRFEGYDSKEDAEKAIGHRLELCKKCVKERDYIIREKKITKKKRST